jgi:hypothetical protein
MLLCPIAYFGDIAQWDTITITIPSPTIMSNTLP